MQSVRHRGQERNQERNQEKEIPAGNGKKQCKKKDTKNRNLVLTPVKDNAILKSVVIRRSIKVSAADFLFTAFHFYKNRCEKIVEENKKVLD